MSFVRPEIASALSRWREVIAACAAISAGLWLLMANGWIAVAVGAILALAGAGWAIVALRRLGFRREIVDPGVVEVDEAQIGYFGPVFGGAIAIPDIAEIRLVAQGTSRAWRIATADHQVLLVPVAAAGAERLHDAFAALPGIDMARLSRALSAAGGSGVLWMRPGRIGATPDRR